MPPSYRYRGKAVIISNKKFVGASNRGGAGKDLRMMKELFTMLDFKVKAYKNLNAQGILDKVEKARTWKEDYEPEYFVFVISTHGGELDMKKKGVIKPAVSGTDGTSVSIDDITTRFVKDPTSAFSGKPKYFFIQACRVREKGKKEDGYDLGKVLPLHQLMQQMMKSKSSGGSPGGTGKQDVSSLSEPGLDVTDDGNGDTGGENVATGGEVDVTNDVTDGVSALLKDFHYDDEISDDEWDGTETDDEADCDVDDVDMGNRDVRDAKLPHGAMNMPNLPSEPNLPSGPKVPNETKVPSEPKMPRGGGDTKTGDDEKDSKGKHEKEMAIEAAHCPEDCLILQPAMPGKYAWRKPNLGSYLLYYMYVNKTMLLENWSFQQYLTKICNDIAERDLHICMNNKGQRAKMCTTISHRLKKDMTFEAQENSFFAIARKKWLSIINKRVLKEAKNKPLPGTEFVY